MAASVFDSQMFNRLFPAGDMSRLFSDTAEIRAMLLVEGALAQVQGAQGIIPVASAKAIHRAAMELQIDPSALATPTGENGVVVPGLLAAFRTAMNAPEHAQYLHWGATSQDVIDTALMLRLRQVLRHCKGAAEDVLKSLAELADTHADLPMVARTYGQHATPTTFGAIVSDWGWPLVDLLGEYEGVCTSSLWVSLSGAAGTASSLGPLAQRTRAELASALDLIDPIRGWHTDRGPLLRITTWMVRVSLALEKLGEDLIALSQTDVSEVRLDASGSSSTMPQKQNPVGPATLVALAAQAKSQHSVLLNAASHKYQRDGSSWFAEWTALPQLVLATAASLEIANPLVKGLTPNASAMSASLDRSDQLIFAEALSFALASSMPRPDAQAATKSLCREAQETRTPLSVLVKRDHPSLDADTLFSPEHQSGHAPDHARAFVKAVQRAIAR